MRCFSCHHENPDAMKFCGACGTELQKVCGACNMTLPVDSTFCGFCGTRLTQQNSPPHTAAERRQISILFCDLVESTANAERLDLEELRDALDAYHNMVGDVIERFGGSIAQYLGDGVVAYFGFPTAHEDDACRAALAGLEILNDVELLKSKDEHLASIVNVRLGLHTGEVVVGGVGTGQHVEQLALGSAPNIAARLQSLASPNELLLSHTTNELIKSQVDTVSVGEYSLKGIDQPMEVFQAKRVQPGSATRLETRRETPFVGRQIELRTIRNLEHDAHEGHGRVLMLRGEPGIGKSRLLLEARNTSKAQWLVCRCSAFHINRPFYPLVALLKEMTKGVDSVAQFEQWYAEFQSSSSGVEGGVAHALIANLLGLDVDRGSLPAGVSNQRTQTIMVLADLFLAIGSSSPTTFVVEDLHWSDPSTLDVLDQMASKIERSSLLMVLTARPDFAEPWVSTGGQTTMELTRLSKLESRELIRRWSTGDIDVNTLSEVVNRSDGVPLYLEEVTRYAADVVRKTNGDLDVPYSLRDSFTARLDSLGSAKSVAQLAALLGRKFKLEQLLAVSEESAATTKQRLAVIVDAGLVAEHRTETATNYTFKHALVQDAAYESMLRSERRRRHKQILSAFEEQQIELGEDVAAWHYQCAGDLHTAIEHFELAAQKALAQWALTECIALFHRGLELVKATPSSEKRDALEMSFLNQLVVPIQAHQHYTAPELFDMVERKLELIRTLDAHKRTNALLGVWAVYGSAGNKDHTMRLASEILDSAEHSNDALVIAKAHETVGHSYFLKGQMEVAAKHLDVSMQRHFVDQDKPAGGVDAVALAALMWHAWTKIYTGQQVVADRSLQFATQTAAQSNSPLSRTHVFSYLNLIRQDLEVDPAIVLDTARSMQRLAIENDMETWSHYFEMHAGWARALSGDEDGIEELGIALERAYPTDMSMRGHSLLSMVHALIAHERLPEALERLDEADAFFERNLSCFMQPDGLRLRANCLAIQGLMDEASLNYAKAADLAASHNNVLMELKARRDEVVHLGPTSGRLDNLRSLYERMQEGHAVPAVKRVAALIS